MELVPNVIIVEGKNDFYVLNYYQKIIKHIKNPLNIIPGTSSSNLETLISLYLGWGTNFTVLLDSDSEGKSQKSRYEELFGLSISDRIITYLDIDQTWNKIEIEQLFSIEDRIVIQKLSYPTDTKFNKKLFNRSIQELYVNNQIINLSSITSLNLDKVLLFLSTKLK